MKTKNVILIVLFTAISSLLSTVVLFYLEQSTSFLIFSTLPGIVFGLMLGIYFKITRKISLGNIMRWSFYSFLAYLLAFWSAYWGFFIMGGYIVGGVIGSLILATYTRKLIAPIKKLSPIVIIGGITGFIFGLLLSPRGVQMDAVFHIEKILYPFLAYFIWQASVTLALEYFMNKEETVLNYDTQIVDPSNTDRPKSTTTLWLGIFIFIITCLIFWSLIARSF